MSGLDDLRDLLSGPLPCLRLPVEADRDGIWMADGDMADGQTVCRVLNALPALLDLADFAAGQVAEEPCRFDHHGGCQEHGYLSLDLGELCPNEMARRALAALGMQP